MFKRTHPKGTRILIFRQLGIDVRAELGGGGGLYPRTLIKRILCHVDVECVMRPVMFRSHSSYGSRPDIALALPFT